MVVFLGWQRFPPHAQHAQHARLGKNTLRQSNQGISLFFWSCFDRWALGFQGILSQHVCTPHYPDTEMRPRFAVLGTFRLNPPICILGFPLDQGLKTSTDTMEKGGEKFTAMKKSDRAKFIETLVKKTHCEIDSDSPHVACALMLVLLPSSHTGSSGAHPGCLRGLERRQPGIVAQPFVEYYSLRISNSEWHSSN